MSKNKERQRYFLKGGKEVAGTTTILDVYAKNALPAWANKLGREGIKLSEYMKERANVGTLTHDLSGGYFIGKAPSKEGYTETEIKEAYECFDKFMEIGGKYSFEPIDIETPLVSEVFEYGGKPDYYGKVDDLLTIGDWKTSDGVYDNMIIQLGAYYGLLKENKKLVQRGAIFNIPPGDKKARATFISVPTLEVGFEIFKHCLSIYNLKRRLK